MTSDAAPQGTSCDREERIAAKSSSGHEGEMPQKVLVVDDFLVERPC